MHSDKIDVAWHKIEIGAGAVRLTEEEVRALNLTGNKEHPLHRVPEEQGRGYLGMLEVFHLLHCLVCQQPLLQSVLRCNDENDTDRCDDTRTPSGKGCFTTTSTTSSWTRACQRRMCTRSLTTASIWCGSISFAM